MAKISKFADKVKKIKRKDEVVFHTDEGEVISFVVESRGEAEIDAINEKYDSQKPKVPTKRLPAKQGQFKVVEDSENPEYKRELSNIQKLNFAEMAILFLAPDERPEGTIEEQIEQLRNVELAGFIPKIVQRGLELSGIIEEADNSFEEEVDAEKND